MADDDSELLTGNLKRLARKGRPKPDRDEDVLYSWTKSSTPRAEGTGIDLM